MLQKYRAKALASFRTKMEVYLYATAKAGNLASANQEDFLEFKLENEIANEYAGKYWQGEEKDSIEEKTIKSIETDIEKWKKENTALLKSWQAAYSRKFENEIFPKEQFEALLKAEKCHYCGSSAEELKTLRAKGNLYKKQLTRGWGDFEIDRKSPNLEYSPENTVMCCYWCNNAKTDEFFEDEFTEIGAAIRKVFLDRLSK